MSDPEKKCCANCGHCGFRDEDGGMIMQCDIHPEARFGWLSKESNDKTCEDWEEADLPF